MQNIFWYIPMSFSMLILSIACESASADLILEISSTSIAARNQSYVDVIVSSRDNTPISIAGFDLSLAIVDVSPVGQPASGELYFLDSFSIGSPDDPLRQSNSEQRAPNYVFRDHAFAENFGAVRQNPNIFQIAIGDSTVDPTTGLLTDVAVTTSRLLARLEIAQRQSIDTALMRGEYEIQLLTAQFFDSSFQAVPLSPIVMPGVVTISAIPEPSSVFLTLTSLLTVFRFRFKRQSWARLRPC